MRSSTTHPEMQNSSFAKSTVRKTVMLSTWPSQSRFAETVHQKLCPQQEVNTFHIKRPHCQAAVWQQVHLHQPQLPPTETMGWGLENSMLVPVLKSLPSVSDTCADFINYSVAGPSNVQVFHCKCRIARLPYTTACKCHYTVNACYNG